MILVTGGEGLVGSNIPGDDLVVTDITEGCPVHLDVTDPEETRRVVLEHKPGAVIHCAAWIDPDACEQDPAGAFRVNVMGTMNVAAACREAGAKMVYVSTQLVFDGRKRTPYREEDAPGPLQQYGLTHFCAEQYAHSVEDHLVVRTSLCHGRCRSGRRYGFVYWVLDSLKAGKTVTVVDTLWTTPTDIRDFGRALRVLVDRDARGTYHYAGREYLSRYAYAVRAAERVGLDPSLIKRIPLEELMKRWVARRPLHAGLDSGKAAAEFGLLPSDPFARLEEDLAAVP